MSGHRIAHCIAVTQILEEFRSMFPDSKVLLTEWQTYKHKILLLAESRPSASLLQKITDDTDDGESRISICSIMLVHSALSFYTNGHRIKGSLHAVICP